LARRLALLLVPSLATIPVQAMLLRGRLLALSWAALAGHMLEAKRIKLWENLRESVKAQMAKS
jgi:hypothetical protein